MKRVKRQCMDWEKIFARHLYLIGVSPLVAQLVKNPSAIQETWVLSLSREDPLEKKMATHSAILAWEPPWTEEPSGL